MTEAVGHKFGGQGSENFRHPCIVRDADCEDDVARGELFAVLQAQAEAIVAALDVRDKLFFQLRNHALAESETVGCERVELHRHLHCGIFQAAFGAELFECEFTLGVRNVRSEAVGLQAHRLWHVQQPALHRAAEDTKWNALATEVGGDRKAVGAGADDSDLGHEREPLL